VVGIAFLIIGLGVAGASFFTVEQGSAGIVQRLAEPSHRQA